MIKAEVWKHVETALGIMERFVIECDHRKINSLAITDAIRILREIPPEQPREEEVV